MKIKRYFAPDIRKAMKMVKQELGSEAVIMSNRSVDGGVEIVAARDFDEQAIQNKLQQHVAAKKKTALPVFESVDEPLHVISSGRKKTNADTSPANPIRQHLDQYLGYAEKIQLAGSRIESQKDAQKRPVKSPSLTTPETAPAPRQPAAAVERMIEEMREEMRGLKALLGTRLAETSRNLQKMNEPSRPDLIGHLSDMGFSSSLATKIAGRLGDQEGTGSVYEHAYNMLAEAVPIGEDRLLEQGGIIALVGPTGVGKTTTLAKLAAQYILQHGSEQVALITTDNYRIGAHEQIRTYGRILNVPVYVANNAEDLQGQIQRLTHKRLILIDTAGMSQRDMRLNEQINTLQLENCRIETYLVMSAAVQYKAMKEIIQAFCHYQPQAAILTKLDETVTLGPCLSAVIEQQLPLAFFTDGQQVPEDIHVPEAAHLIGQCVAGIDKETDYTGSLSDLGRVAEGYA